MKNYLNSFKLNKNFLYPLVTDIIFVAVIMLAVSLFGGYIQQQTTLLGVNPQNMQQFISTLSAGELQQFLEQVKFLLFTLVGGAILILICSFLLFSYSRSLVWFTLTRKKQKYWKWNLLIIMLLLLLLIYTTVFLIVKLIINLLLQQLTSIPWVFFIFNQLLTILFLVSFILFSFLVFYSFSKRYKVFSAIEKAFSIVKQKWSVLWKSFLFSVLILIVLSLIAALIQKQFFYYAKPIYEQVFQIAIILLFVSWMRSYVFRVIHR